MKHMTKKQMLVSYSTRMIPPLDRWNYSRTVWPIPQTFDHSGPKNLNKFVVNGVSDRCFEHFSQSDIGCSILKTYLSEIRVVGKGSQKEREVGKFKVGKSDVGKFLFKLERALQTRKGPSKVGKNQVNFSTSARTFQLRSELSNFNLSIFISDFPTSFSFQLPFPTTRIPPKSIAVDC